MRWCWLSIGLSLCAAASASVAAADSFDYGEDNPWHDAHPELSAAVGVRDVQRARVAATVREVELACARRGPRWTSEVAVGVGLLDVGRREAAMVRQRRALAVLGGYPDSLRRWDAWLELGAGVERFAAVDARLTRPVIAFGFGVDLDAGNDTSLGDALHWMGARVAVRLSAAPAPALDARARCVGTCARPAGGVDLGVAISLGLLIGR